MNPFVIDPMSRGWSTQDFWFSESWVEGLSESFSWENDSGYTNWLKYPINQPYLFRKSRPEDRLLANQVDPLFA